jgi:quercetin dioxygenase-like cupin family protein
LAWILWACFVEISRCHSNTILEGAILKIVKLHRPTSVETRVEFPIPTGNAITGILEFKAGTRLPLEGTSVHDQDEISFILSGKLSATSGGESCTLQAGDISFIPALEHHWALVLEDTRLAYVLVPRTEGR